MANKNRDKGHRFERKLLKLLRPIYPKIKTSRNASLELDANGIDFVNTGSIAIQSKTLKQRPNFNNVLSKMKTKLPKVFIYKDNKIRGKDGEYAVLRLEDLITLLTDLDA